MWFVERYFNGNYETSSYSEPIFATLDQKLAQDSADKMNANLEQAENMIRPFFPKSLEGTWGLLEWTRYYRESWFNENIKPLLEEFDPGGVSQEISGYRVVEIEVR